MSRIAKIGSVKYLKREWDARGEYEVGGTVTFKWHVPWRIEKVVYNPVMDITHIRLRRIAMCMFRKEERICDACGAEMFPDHTECDVCHGFGFQK